MIFGSDLQHLDVVFLATDPARTVTDVLAGCGHPEPWDAPVSARIARLLEIVEVTTGASFLEAVTACAACGERASIELSIAELKALEPKGRDCVEVDSLCLRRPTGRDQLEWRRRGFASPREAVELIARSLWVGSDPPDPFPIERAGEVLEELDPLVAFRVELPCPGCEVAQRAAIDIQDLCLVALRRVHDELITCVHRLARAYGWTEREVLGLPVARRRRYLDLVEGAAA